MEEVSNVVTSDQLGAWLLLQLAEQGRPHEVVAQFMASWLMSSDLDKDEIEGWWVEWERIQDRSFFLCLHPEGIWDGLLPGPGGGPHLGLNVIQTSEWNNLRSARDILEGVKAAFVANYDPEFDTEYGQRLEAVGKALGYGLPPTREPVVHEPNSIDEHEYAVSIIIDPRVGHGQATDLIEEAVVYYETSPLNLARKVWDWIDRLDRRGKWPAEELSAWITHHESKTHLLMTFDQAAGIKALEEASEKLQMQDFDDTFQHEYETMLIAGKEYVAGKDRCGQPLYRDGKFVGRCSEIKYTEHDHN